MTCWDPSRRHEHTPQAQLIPPLALTLPSVGRKSLISLISKHTRPSISHCLHAKRPHLPACRDSLPPHAPGSLYPFIQAFEQNIGRRSSADAKWMQQVCACLLPSSTHAAAAPAALTLHLVAAAVAVAAGLAGRLSSAVM